MSLEKFGARITEAARPTSLIGNTPTAEIAELQTELERHDQAGRHCGSAIQSRWRQILDPPPDHYRQARRALSVLVN